MKLSRLFLILAAAPLLALMGCQSDGLSPNEYGTWTYTGYVLDGNTRLPIEGAVIDYADKEGAAQAATTDGSGAFVIQGLPFGDRTFKFSHRDSGDSAATHTSKIVVISSLNESRSIEGVIGNVSMVVSLFPLKGRISGTLSARLPGSAQTTPAPGVVVKLRYNDTALVNASPILFDAVTDSRGHFSLRNLPLAPGAALIFNGKKINGTLYEIPPVDISELFDRGEVDLGVLYLSAKDSSNLELNLVRSNVLSGDGFGLTNVPVDQTLYYVLPVPPRPGSVSVTLSGGAIPNTRLQVKDDTLFIDPQGNFSFDTQVSVEINGLDTAGNQIHFAFDGVKQFRTEKGIHALESNAWERIGHARRDFKPDDTLWVRFSAALDPDVNKISWSPSSATRTILAGTYGINASAWVSADTLFVRPDQRLSVDFGETMGFKISVLSRDGKRSDTLDVVATVIADPYFVRWTNTKNFLGNMREDFGPSDSVIVVSNSPIREIRGLSAISGRTPPPDLFLDNVKVRGDTIVYKPSLYLKPDSVYGIDFDILFADGNLRRDVLPVAWKTASTIQILSVDNRRDGLFRPLNAIGDSFTVVFSTAIDTNDAAPVPFKVHIRDVNGESVRSSVRWSADRRAATVFNVDTLPTADFDASPAYADDAVGTRAVSEVSFDLSTDKGERVFDFTPSGANIELHTEKGLCVVNANILGTHDRRLAVERSETPLTNFERNAPVVLTFSRALDTAAVRADTLNDYIQIRKATDTVAIKLDFSADAKSAILTPVATLLGNTEYRVILKDVPALGISGAAPINKHGGTFSGTALNNSLLDAAFKTRP